MKKIILLMLVFFASISYAQGTSAEHMTFKGIPIDGSLSSFISKMKSENFTYIGTQDGVAIFQGDFAGYKNCEVGVLSLKETNVVNTVVVFFPECSDWPSIEQNYSIIKNMLSEKYGDPVNCVEEFQGYSKPQSDNDKWYKLIGKLCTYYSYFETEKGDISIEMFSADYTTCRVKLQYWDKINTNTVRDNAMDDL